VRSELLILPQAKRVGLLVVEKGVNLCIRVNDDEAVNQVLTRRRSESLSKMHDFKISETKTHQSKCALQW